MRNNNAFTLIELSVVIVIIGLIVAGIVAGQSLVLQAQLRNVVSEHSGLMQAIQSFRLQYNQFPGDINNAHDYWGSDCAADPDHCNGDNNKTIHYHLGLGVDNEGLRAMQHLVLAGLLEGSYTGVGVASGSVVGGINAPVSKLREGSILIGARAHFITSASIDNKNVRTIILFGKDRPSFHNTAAMFKVAEASSLDAKIDDGVPLTGQFFGTNAGVGPNPCTNGSNGALSSYRLDIDDVACIAFFVFN